MFIRSEEISVCLVLGLLDGVNEELECQENSLTSAWEVTMRAPWAKKRTNRRRGLMGSPNMDHKTGPEGDFRCDGNICQSLFGVQAEQLINLLSY